MDFEGRSFGRGPKELGGAVDLVNQFKLWPLYESFCKRSLPVSISETNYLRNVVGDTEIRKGEGMELDQLFQNASHLRERNACIHQFDLHILKDAFRIRDTAPVELSFAEKGKVAKLKHEFKEKAKKHKKHKNKDKEDKGRKRKHQYKDKSGDKNTNINVSHGSSLEHLNKQLEKKRRLNSIDDLPVRGLQRNMVMEVNSEWGFWWLFLRENCPRSLYFIATGYQISHILQKWLIWCMFCRRWLNWNSHQKWLIW